jgi:lysylphosphatidylglycerol synthetase-like protein (DUF2156 family)
MELISEAARIVDHPSGFLACSPRNRVFRVPGRDGFVSYREQGRHWIAFGGVHAPERDARALLRMFLEAARVEWRTPLFVQVPPHQVPLFEEAGATVNRLGSTFALRLRDFTLRGTAKIPLRNKIHKARRSGLRAVELGRDHPLTDALLAQRDAVSCEWLADKRKKELAFMIGEASDACDEHRRTFAALDGEDRLAAFITYVPAWGRYPGYLHDLSRRKPQAPPGALELVNAFAIERFREEHAAYLHFGFTPFVMSGEEPASASRLMARISRFLYEHGRFVYPAASQASYKRKWGTDLVMPEHIAGFPLSLPALVALLRLTRAV